MILGAAGVQLERCCGAAAAGVLLEASLRMLGCSWHCNDSLIHSCLSDSFPIMLPDQSENRASGNDLGFPEQSVELELDRVFWDITVVNSGESLVQQDFHKSIRKASAIKASEKHQQYDAFMMLL
jgi:hypothetical protein